MKSKLLPIIILPLLVFSGCSPITEYIDNLTSPERKDLVVYNKGKDYDDTQFDLIIPPDLINPSLKDNLEIPGYNEEGIDVFTVDTKLEGITILRSGRDSFISLKTTDKEYVWKKLSDFWLAEGFRLSKKDYMLGIMKTGFLENLSEAQLGTMQRIVGRYVPLLVAPETRDSYSTRVLLKDDSLDILITHYGKEYMSDGDTEFRWQNRPRDPEFESEMISRLYIYLGGEEAKSKGYSVVQSTGVRNKASMSIDENGFHTLYINDIYARVWPAVIKSLEVYGINILSTKEEDGLIKVSVQEKEASSSSMLDYLAFWKSSEDIDSFNIVLITTQEGTVIEIQNDMFSNITNTATEEIIRALYTDLR
ncbi:outer membrane protein assembly factor BamC [Gammaproteobacteria bacterium]|nr:outer membrane protein assembly factor BamC [Gammaproteobacteria bacterium]